MSRGVLRAAKFEPSMTITVELTEIDGIEPEAILRFTDVGKSGRPSEAKEFRTCYKVRIKIRREEERENR